MGFFKDFKRDFAQAVNELMPDKDELANEYDDEDIVNTFDDNDDMDIAPEDMMENIDDIPSDNVTGNEDTENMGVSYLDNEISDDSADTEDTADSDDGINNIPEAEIITENYSNELDVFTDEENPEEELLEAIPPEELSSETASEGTSEASDMPVEAEPYSFDELKAVDALDEENMLENIEDAEAIEPVANALDGMDLNEAVEDAINKNDNSETSVDTLYEEDNMAEEDKIIEKIIEEETTKEKEQEANSILSDDTTYITKGTTIKGSIETDGGIDVIGTVEGDVTCGGKLIIGGTIEGNINAGEIYANAAKIKGEIVTEGSVKIGVGTVVVGNVSATSAVIAGAINGDIDVHGPVIVDSTAVIMGDIKSRSVQINNGAVIEGRCSQCYSEIDVKSFFE